MPQQKSYYIIDFDSTFTQVEALDELARISLKNHPDREAIYKKIEDYTNLSMEGKLSFSESLGSQNSTQNREKESQNSQNSRTVHNAKIVVYNLLVMFFNFPWYLIINLVH